MNPNFTTYVRQNAMVRLQFYLEHSVRQCLHDGSFHLNYIVFYQVFGLASLTGPNRRRAISFPSSVSTTGSPSHTTTVCSK